jgi:hypothetical protein
MSRTLSKKLAPATGRLQLLEPVAPVACGARGNDCGPEPSLRTSPLSSSSPAVGGFLQIPSGLSTPRAPQATGATGSSSCNLTVAGASFLLRVLLIGGVGEEDLAGPAPCRPRGRPCGAYAVSCVGVVSLREACAVSRFAGFVRGLRRGVCAISRFAVRLRGVASLVL